MGQALGGVSLSRQLHMGEGGGAEGGPRIARGGLHKEIPERPVHVEAAIGDAVEGDAPRQTQVVARRDVVEVANLVEENLFEDHLQAAGDIDVDGGNLALGHPWFHAKQGRQQRRKHPSLLGKIKVGRAQAELAAGQHRDELAHLVGETGGAIGGQAHHLVFVAQHRKTEEIRDGAVQQAQ